MKQFIKDYFSKSDDVSSMRVNVFIAMLVFVAIAVCVMILAFTTRAIIVNQNGVEILTPADYTVIRELTYFATSILFVAFGLKTWQKFAERETTINKKDE